MLHAFVIVTLVRNILSLVIPSDERESLLQDLDLWKTRYHSKANDQGLIPESDSIDDPAVTEMYLQRLYTAKQLVPHLEKQNPFATFSHISPYALLSSEEFAHRLGNVYKNSNAPRALRTERLGLATTLPSSVDWVSSKCMNPIQDQGLCGSCWAFVATGAIEAAHCLATGNLLKLSEQQVVDCNVGLNRGCSGGSDYLAMQYIQSNGQCLASMYPYESGTTTVPGTCRPKCSPRKLSVGAIASSTGEAALQAQISVQPVAVSVYAGNSVWQLYTGGIVSGCPANKSDHAVLAVGYGVHNGQKYFKLRNSWGSWWGEKGYIRVANGIGGFGSCNVGQYLYYPTIVSGQTSLAPISNTFSTTPKVIPPKTPTAAPYSKPTTSSTPNLSLRPTTLPKSTPTTTMSSPKPTSSPIQPPTTKPSTTASTVPPIKATKTPKSTPTTTMSSPKPTSSPIQPPTTKPSTTASTVPPIKATKTPKSDTTPPPTQSAFSNKAHS